MQPGTVLTAMSDSHFQQIMSIFVFHVAFECRNVSSLTQVIAWRWIGFGTEIFIITKVTAGYFNFDVKTLQVNKQIFLQSNFTIRVSFSWLALQLRVLKRTSTRYIIQI